jgi:hypothetical protein
MNAPEGKLGTTHTHTHTHEWLVASENSESVIWVLLGLLCGPIQVCVRKLSLDDEHVRELEMKLQQKLVLW